MPTLRNIKSWNLMPQWGDSLGVASFNGNIHAVGQARLAIYASSKHYIFDTSGRTIADIDAPITPNGEMITSTLGGVLHAYGGTSDTKTYKFDPSIAGNTSASWSTVDTTYVATIGSRNMAVGIDGPDGNHWIFGGWNNDTYAKTSTFLPGSWTVVGDLPASIKKIAACAICVIGDEIFLIGGATGVVADLYAGNVNGEIWAYKPSTDAWRLVYTSKGLFGSIWIDGACSEDYVYVSKGFVSTAQLATLPGTPRFGLGNLRGVVYALKTDLTAWTEMDLIDGNLIRFETHRAAMVYHSGNVYQVAGYQDNGMWVIDE